MLSIVKSGYQRMLPLSVRARLWHLRGEFQLKLRDFSDRFNVNEGKNLPPCNACRGKNLVRFKTQAVARLPYKFFKCEDCGFIFVPPPKDLSGVYTDTTMPEFGEGEGIWNSHYLDSINKYAEGRGKILEIGFGNASFLKLAHERGWEVYGAELSEVLVRYAREELKLPNIGLGTIEQLGYPDDFFDVVAGFNFLEHVPDPRATLEDMRRVLRPGGLVVLMCPNISGIYHLLMPEVLAENDPLKITWVPPHHLSYFDKTNLSKLMESVGFTVVGDESHLMSSLWRQFEVSIGPKATDEKFSELVSRIRSASSPKGDGRVSEFRQEIKSLIVERMTWTMLSDLIEIESLLGAEVGVLLLGKKVEV